MTVGMSVPEQSLTPLGKMQSAIQLAGFHYVVCLKALPTNADHRLTIEKIEYVFDAIRRTESRALHSEFQRWAAMVVLRDLIESFSVFLMEIYANAIQENPRTAYSVTIDHFERKGIEDQLGILSKNFAVSEAWVARLVGYNRARNCLAHRQGIVGPRDATNGRELVVRWLVSKTELTNGPVTPFVEAVGPMNSLIGAQHIHGGAVFLAVQDKERRISVGSILHLLPTDILEICQTFQLAAAAFSALEARS